MAEHCHYMEMGMDLRVLRYFLAVVREESITAAAESLHVTQPTLSRQLMDLEKGLGCALCLDRLASTSLESDLRFFPYEPPMEVPLDLAWKKYQVFSKAAELFLDRMKQL